MHNSALIIEKVEEKENQPTVIRGTLKPTFVISSIDKAIIGENRSVVLKRYDLETHEQCFKREIKILKRIKFLKLEKNAGFPIILSAKHSESYGELIISSPGCNIIPLLDLYESM